MPEGVSARLLERTTEAASFQRTARERNWPNWGIIEWTATTAVIWPKASCVVLPSGAVDDVEAVPADLRITKQQLAAFRARSL
jgi:hypothetical protein